MTAQLQQNYYDVLPNFISKEKAGELAQSFKNFCADMVVTNPVRLKDTQVPGSYSFYNFIDFMQVLVEETARVGSILGEPVLPTYCFSRIYKHNTQLVVHNDRNSCEISLTIHLGGDREWPIYMLHQKQQPVPINLDVGDAVIYFGPKIEHWRTPYQGEEYIQMFLHYVRSKGENSHLAFDSEIREHKAISKYRKFQQLNSNKR